MDELEGFIMVDNYEAVRVGDFENDMESRPMVKPKFTTDFPEAVVREGADELTLRAEEEGTLCEWEGDVVAVVAPLGGVAQVVSHGVQVVGVHGEEGKEKGRGSAGGSKRRSRATQRETLIMDGMWMKVKDSRTT